LSRCLLQIPPPKSRFYKGFFSQKIEKKLKKNDEKGFFLAACLLVAV
jgi:hypothetical protein